MHITEVQMLMGKRRVSGSSKYVIDDAATWLKEHTSAPASLAVVVAIASQTPSQSMLWAATGIALDRFIPSVPPVEAPEQPRWYRPWHHETVQLKALVRRAGEEAAMLGSGLVGPDHFLLAVLSLYRDPTAIALRAAGLSRAKAYDLYDEFYKRSRKAAR